MNKVKIAWYGLHKGEEPPLNPAGGIFFTGCDLRCVFCQNYQISQKQVGSLYDIDGLVNIMLELQKNGAKNIDLVSPNGWWQSVKPAVFLAREQGLKIPIVWNSNGYENREVLKDMAQVVDIYLPDFKYADDTLAEKYSGIKNYTETVVGNIKEMIKQVGFLKIENRVAKRGVIVRHMVLPGLVKNSLAVLRAIRKIDKNIHISLMNQYNPLFKARDYPEINREVSDKEFDKVYGYLLELGFINGWVQGDKSQGVFVPDFKKSDPFSK